MSKATLLHHQGYGDYFSSNGLVNYYSKKYDELILICADENRKIFAEYMYRHLSNVKCVCEDKNNQNSFDSSCVICHTKGNPRGRCPRDNNYMCEYINYEKYIEDYDNIKIGCFSEHIGKWDECRLHESHSFSHAFYLYHQIPIEYRIDNFSIFRDLKLEETTFNQSKFVDKDYIVIHDDPNRGIKIDLENDYIYNLNGKSKLFLDQIKMIENSKEIHLIDSSYSLLIYFLSFQNEKISSIPKFLYKNRGVRDYDIYLNPKPKNWYFV